MNRQEAFTIRTTDKRILDTYDHESAGYSSDYKLENIVWLKQYDQEFFGFDFEVIANFPILYIKSNENYIIVGENDFRDYNYKDLLMSVPQISEDTV